MLIKFPRVTLIGILRLPWLKYVKLHSVLYTSLTLYHSSRWGKATFVQYPTSNMKLKMHHMVHYPSQIERFGPLLHSWTMRHGAKLSFIKRSSQRGNFKNIVKTVIKHHQLWLCYQLTCDITCCILNLSLAPNKQCRAYHRIARTYHLSF